MDKHYNLRPHPTPSNKSLRPVHRETLNNMDPDITSNTQTLTQDQVAEQDTTVTTPPTTPHTDTPDRSTPSDTLIPNNGMEVQNSDHSVFEETKSNEDDANSTTSSVPTELNTVPMTHETSTNLTEPSGLQKILQFLHNMDHKFENMNLELKQTNHKFDVMREDHLALKHDLNNQFNAMDNKMENLSLDNQCLRTELMTHMDDRFNLLNDHLRSEIATTKSELKSEINSMRNENKDMEGRMIERCKRMESERKETEKQLINRVSNIECEIQETKGEQEKQIENKVGGLAKQLEHLLLDTRNVVNNRCITHEQKVEERLVEIQKVQEHLTRTKEVMRSTVEPANIIVQCGSGGMSDNLPKFDGRARNPVEFLKRLNDYHEQVNKKYGPQNSSNYVEMLDNALIGQAGKWWKLIRHTITTKKEFETHFMEQYWCSEVQRSLKREIENSMYREGGNLSRTEYFLDKVLLLKNLTPPIDDIDIINIIGEGFSERVRDATRVQNVSTINDYLNLLRREDMTDMVERKRARRGREDERKDNRPNHFERQHQKFIPQKSNQYNSGDNNGRKPEYRQAENKYNNYEKGNEQRYRDHAQRNPNYDRGKINTYQHYGRPNERHIRWEKRYPTSEQSNVCEEVTYPRHSDRDRSRTPPLNPSRTATPGPTHLLGGPNTPNLPLNGKGSSF